jgi:hypothetical protein
VNFIVPAILGFVAASIAVPLIKRLFNRRGHVQAGRESGFAAAASMPELRRWNRTYQLATGAGFLGFCLIFWPCFVLTARTITRAPDCPFRFVVPSFAWLLPAMGLAIVTSGVVAEGVLRRLLGARYEEFVRYRDDVSGYRVVVAARFVIPGTLVLTAIGSVLLANRYVCFSDNEILVHNFWSFGLHRYDYSNVVWIGSAPAYVAPSGAIVRRREYLFRFNDGSSWSTLSDPSGASRDTRDRLAQWVSARSGCHVVELPRFERGDL